MYNLQDIVMCATSNKCALQRGNKTKALYNSYKAKVLEEYCTYEDYIKIKYMSYVGHRYENSGKVHATKTNDSVPLAFVPNKFPYNIEKSMSHYVLFSEKPLREKRMKAVLQKLLPNKEYVTLVNSPEHMSIPNLWHCHVFIVAEK